MTLLLCGFMGSGKTSLLKKLLKESSSYSGFDLDHEVAAELKIDHEELGEWINQHSLAEFRKHEADVLSRLLSQKGEKIIALGGGTLEAPSVFEQYLKHDDVLLIFLNVPFETCLLRVQGDKNRPLLSLSTDDLKKLHTERMFRYQQADLILSESEIKEIDGLSRLMHNLDGR